MTADDAGYYIRAHSCVEPSFKIQPQQCHGSCLLLSCMTIATNQPMPTHGWQELSCLAKNAQTQMLHILYWWSSGAN